MDFDQMWVVMSSTGPLCKDGVIIKTGVWSLEYLSFRLLVLETGWDGVVDTVQRNGLSGGDKSNNG